MKKAYHLLENNIYNTPLTIFIGSYKECEAYLHRVYGLDKQEQRYYGGYSQILTNLNTGEVRSFIWMPKYNHMISDIGTLSHECLHIAMRTLESCNTPVSHNNHEALAYLHNYILEHSLFALRERF